MVGERLPCFCTVPWTCWSEQLFNSESIATDNNRIVVLLLLLFCFEQQTSKLM